LIASEYAPVRRYMSPRSLSRRPPAIPVRVAEVYFDTLVAVFNAAEMLGGGPPVPEVERPMSAAERRKGLEDWVGMATCEMAVVGMGIADGA
jgi:hypothetical protein